MCSQRPTNNVAKTARIQRLNASVNVAVRTLGGSSEKATLDAANVYEIGPPMQIL